MRDPIRDDLLTDHPGETDAERAARLRAWLKAFEKEKRERAIRAGRRKPRTQREMRMFLDAEEKRQRRRERRETKGEQR